MNKRYFPKPSFFSNENDPLSDLLFLCGHQKSARLPEIIMAAITFLKTKGFDGITSPSLTAIEIQLYIGAKRKPFLKAFKQLKVGTNILRSGDGVKGRPFRYHAK